MSPSPDARHALTAQARARGLETRVAAGVASVRARNTKGEVDMTIAYNLADSYGSVWRPGVFTEGFMRKLPKSVWGHDHLDIIGSAYDYEETPERLTINVRMADFDDVPSARRAYALIRDGHCDEVSFAFRDAERKPIPPDQRRSFGELDALEEMLRAIMVEVSPVLDASIPRSTTTGVRAAGANSTGTPAPGPGRERVEVRTRKVTLDQLQAAYWAVQRGAVPESDAVELLSGAAYDDAAPAVGDDADPAVPTEPSAGSDAPGPAPAVIQPEPVAPAGPPVPADVNPDVLGEETPTVVQEAPAAPEAPGQQAPAPAPELPADVAALADTASSLTGPRSRPL